MSENALDSKPSTNNTDEIGGANVKSNENEIQDNVTSRETEASELKARAIVSGCTTDDTRVDCELSTQSDNDAHFQQPRTASTSFNSDSTESSFVTHEGKHDISPAAGSQTDTVAGKSDEQFIRGIPAAEGDPFLQSVKYLEKHQILRLFQVRPACTVKIPENLISIFSKVFT